MAVANHHTAHASSTADLAGPPASYAVVLAARRAQLEAEVAQLAALVGAPTTPPPMLMMMMPRGIVNAAADGRSSPQPVPLAASRPAYRRIFDAAPVPMALLGEDDASTTSIANAAYRRRVTTEGAQHRSEPAAEVVVRLSNGMRLACGPAPAGRRHCSLEAAAPSRRARACSNTIAVEPSVPSNASSLAVGAGASDDDDDDTPASRRKTRPGHTTAPGTAATMTTTTRSSATKRAADDVPGPSVGTIPQCRHDGAAPPENNTATMTTRRGRAVKPRR
mmetsp:Transcript_6229/g.26095  ORF Transcript_6229/g.26095 Transcript_6229/m.26095 type:complete len:278 (-) Transcript_6229:90-923(-)